MIGQQDNEEILNSRSEWGSNRIPRLVVDPDIAGQVRPNQQAPEVNPEVKETSIPGQGSSLGQGQVQKGGKRKPPQVKVESTRGVPDSSNNVKRPKLNIKDHFKI